MTAASLKIGVDWVWRVPNWKRLQHALVLARAIMGLGEAGLGFCIP